ncbi:protein kinase domain-containing protein [Sorangium sp. So ce1128]
MRRGMTRLAPGECFLRFRIERVLGEGGLGVVYAASTGGRSYAIKLVRAEWIDDEEQRRRLVCEGALMELLKHPNIVEVHETGITSDGIAWMRMELLDGHTLREALIRHQRLSAALACAFLRQAGHGVYQCHALGVVHRDLKPENLFITRDHTLKVLDFGIAKLYGKPDTLDQQTHGTPGYMAPEQIRRQPASPATDVYALGVIAYEALRGTNPFVDLPGERDVRAVLAQHLLYVPPSLEDFGCPKEVAAVVARALEKEPRARHEHALAFAEDLWEAFQRAKERDGSLTTYPAEPAIEALRARFEEASGATTDRGPWEGEDDEDEPASSLHAPASVSASEVAALRSPETAVRGDADPEAAAAGSRMMSSAPSSASHGGNAPTLAPGEVTPRTSAGRAESRGSAVTFTPVARTVPLVPPGRFVPVDRTIPLAPAPRFVPVNQTVRLPPEASHGAARAAASEASRPGAAGRRGLFPWVHVRRAMVDGLAAALRPNVRSAMWRLALALALLVAGVAVGRTTASRSAISDAPALEARPERTPPEQPAETTAPSPVSAAPGSADLRTVPVAPGSAALRAALAAPASAGSRAVPVAPRSTGLRAVPVAPRSTGLRAVPVAYSPIPALSAPAATTSLAAGAGKATPSGPTRAPVAASARPPAPKATAAQSRRPPVSSTKPLF